MRLTIADAARVKGVTWSAVNNAIKNGRLTGIEEDGKVYVDGEELAKVDFARRGQSPAIQPGVMQFVAVKETNFSTTELMTLLPENLTPERIEELTDSLLVIATAMARGYTVRYQGENELYHLYAVADPAGKEVWRHEHRKSEGVWDVAKMWLEFATLASYVSGPLIGLGETHQAARPDSAADTHVVLTDGVKRFGSAVEESAYGKDSFFYRVSFGDFRAAESDLKGQAVFQAFLMASIGAR